MVRTISEWGFTYELDDEARATGGPSTRWLHWAPSEGTHKGAFNRRGAMWSVADRRPIGGEASERRRDRWHARPPLLIIEVLFSKSRRCWPAAVLRR